MAWRKLGRIFCADGQRDFMMSHASCPQAVRLEGDLYRIWFAPRDAGNRSHTAWLEIDITRPSDILRLAEEPVLAPGAFGAFDEQGAMHSWFVAHDGEARLYYTGWNIGDTVPFRNAIGLARWVNGDRNHFDPEPGPVLDRSPEDPCFVGNPCVLHAAGRWHLWYLSGTRWIANGNGAPPHAAYNLRRTRRRRWISPIRERWPLRARRCATKTVFFACTTVGAARVIPTASAMPNPPMARFGGGWTTAPGRSRRRRAGIRK